MSEDTQTRHVPKNGRHRPDPEPEPEREDQAADETEIGPQPRESRFARKVRHHRAKREFQKLDPQEREQRESAALNEAWMKSSLGSERYGLGPRTPGFTDMQQMRADMAQARRIFTTDTTNDAKLRFLQPDAASRRNYDQMDLRHRSYVTMMCASALEPLANGVTASSIAESLGMSAAMWILSKDFRDVVKVNGNSMIDSAQDKVRTFVQDRLERNVQKCAEQGKPVDEKTAAGLERLARMERGGRQPFTAVSAGLMHASLNMGAYEALREPGADPDAVMEQYNADLKALYEMAAEDNLSADDVARGCQIAIGQIVDDDPRKAAMFEGLSNGAYVRAPEHLVQTAEGRPVSVWNGEYVCNDGSSFEGNAFIPRAPMTPDEHELSMQSSLVMEMLGTKDPAILNQMLFANATAFYAMQDSDAMDAVNDTPLDPRVSRAFTRAMSMDQAMKDDGMADPIERQACYSNAFMQALDEVSMENPGIVRQWEKTFGQDWQKTFTTLVESPDGPVEMWKKAAAERRGEREHSDGEAMHDHDDIHADPSHPEDPSPHHGTFTSDDHRNPSEPVAHHDKPASTRQQRRQSHNARSWASRWQQEAYVDEDEIRAHPGERPSDLAPVPPTAILDPGESPDLEF